jgi:hypothetical protein
MLGFVKFEITSFWSLSRFTTSKTISQSSFHNILSAKTPLSIYRCRGECEIDQPKLCDINVCFVLSMLVTR